MASPGAPSMLAIGTTAPTSSRLSPLVRAQVQTCPLKTPPQAPCTSTMGTSFAQAEARIESARHFASSARRMVWLPSKGDRIGARPEPTYPLFRKGAARNGRRNLERVAVVELLEHRVRKPEAVELPERVVIPVVVEILVVGFEDPPV